MEEKYTVSARKFRPQTFGQVVGQPHIVRTLTNALSKKRIGQAYLFSGTRGVGKTTTARILAKALNCKNGPTPEPCLECDNCREIAAGTSIDVMEIDGASNTGIDNIRDLRENVKFSPTKSKYKIYIIDEVHQISKAAFNALLKTLEEPPAHVVFIFATTELNKVPDTILSRCQSFEYKSIGAVEIAAQLRMIAEHEKVEATQGAIDLLARRARGSMRDAQSLFDQTAAFGGGTVTEDDVKHIMGTAPRSALFGLIDAIIAGDRAAVMDIAESVAYSGSDPALFIEDLSEMIRHIMSVKVRPGNPPDLEEDEKEKLAAWSRALDFDEIQRLFNGAMDTMDQMRRSHLPSLNLEMGLLRMADNRGLVSVDALLDKVARAQAAVEREDPPAPPVVRREAAPPPEEREGELPLVDSNVEAAPPEIERKMSGGGEAGVAERFKRELKRPVLKTIFQTAVIHSHDDTVAITVNSLYEREQLEEAENRKRLEEIASGVLGKRARVVIKVQAAESPDDGSKKKQRERESAIKQQMYDTPIVQSAMELFSGELVEIKVDRDA